MWTEKEVIEKQIKDGNWDIVCLTETHEKQGQEKVTNIAGYRKISQNRFSWDKKGGGISVWLKSGITFSEIGVKKESINRITEIDYG